MRRCSAFLLQCALSVVSVLTSTIVHAQVDTLWTRRHEFPFDFSFNAIEMSFGPDGSIYQAGEAWCCDGSSVGVLRYTTDGEELWASMGLSTPGLALRAMAVDGTGNLYVAGDGLRTAKYSAEGQLLWSRYGPFPVAPSTPRVGPLNEEFGADVAVDDSGYVYTLTFNFVTIKYTPDGDTVWTRPYDSPDGNTGGWTISVSGEGEVWSTGAIFATGSNQDVLTIHYSSTGDSLWALRLNNLGGADMPGAQILDEAGHLYVAGHVTLTDSRPAFVAKLTPLGDTAWVRYHSDSLGLPSTTPDITLDPSNNVLITVRHSSTGPDHFTVVKLAPNGQPLWDRATTEAPMFAGGALTVDTAGNIYLTATDFSDSGPSTWKFSPEGDLVWQHWIDGADILTDDSGHVYVAGWDLGGEKRNIAKLSQDDSDGDLVIDFLDNCPSTPNTNQQNGDADSLGDACDNCPQVTNPEQAVTVGITGDLDQSGSVSSADIILMVNFIFKSGPPPAPCLAVGDANCSQSITSADIVVVVNYVFKAGLAPCDVCATDGPTWSCP